MKNRVGAIVLILTCVGLGIALIVIKKKDTDRQKSDAVTIETYSNKWVSTATKLEERTQVAAVYEKDLDSQKKAFADLTNDFTRLSGNLTQVSATLSQTEVSLKAAREEVAKRDAKIADLENQNQALDKQAIELGTAITNLTEQIRDTKKKLAASEGDKAYLESQLKRLMAEKSELERQFNDLAVLRVQVRKLKEELSLARRLDWIHRGVAANPEVKGAQRLMQGAGATKPKPPKPNYDLNVEVGSQGTARILPTQTNAAAATNPPAK